ncbi:hypothetical protein QM467_01365 [Rhodoblastus sp. 17X3]|uniref:hypothetical protein n=1 Tax=Rhodoblastus sp. 17X3 TaxID=3047026 RepID=UPI0024B6F560|nr:hypothetical protein [Rhodoblastus sp. 17X3]MDI9846703.1 hypothetical protein [Rhodoblastus sp. 17X3]
MVPMTILVDEKPRCVVRPNDMKGLQRFLRNGKSWLLAENPDASLSYREADEAEKAVWSNALGLHRAWGGDEEDYFGAPL